MKKSFFASIGRMGRINSKTIFFGLYPEHPVNRCQITIPFAHAAPEWVESSHREPLKSNFTKVLFPIPPGQLLFEKHRERKLFRI